MLGVLLGAPVSAELVQGYLDVTGDLAESLFLVVFLAPLYGGAALVIREVAVRTGRGWPGILALSWAFGVAMPGLIDLSLFAEHRPDVRGWEELWSPTAAGGVSWHPAFTWSAAHVVMSIGVPLALLDALAPSTRGRSLLGWKGVVALGVSCVGVAALIRRDAAPGSVPTPQQTVCVLVVVGLLVALALSPFGRSMGRRYDGRRTSTASVGLAGLVGFAVMASLDFPPPTWAGLGLAVVLTLSLGGAIAGAARFRPWGTVHVTSLACGALVERTLVGCLSPLPPGVGPSAKLVQAAIVLAGVATVSALAVRRSAAGAPGPGLEEVGSAGSSGRLRPARRSASAG